MRKMKDSGIAWIGKIPEDWDVQKLKYLGILTSNGVDKKIKEGQKLFKSVHYMDVYRNSLRELQNSADYLMISADDNKSISCQLNKGDVLFTNSSETPEDIGHSTVIKEDLENILFGYHLMRFRPGSGIELHYEKYLFGSHYIRKWFEYRATGMTRYGLSRTDFEEILIVLPSLAEQTQIGIVLDHKCTKIDETIEMEKEVIEKLKTYKQSVITEAVTRGLDPNVPMKDSGVEWIGKIPKHWQCRRLKGVTKKTIDGTHNTPNYQEKGIPFLRVTDITVKDGTKQGINWGKTAYIRKEEHEQLIKRCNPEKGDLLVSKNGTIGVPKVVDWDRPFSIFVSLCLIKTRENLDVEYLYNYFKSTLIWTEIAIGGKTGTITNLHLDKIREFRIPLPPLQEQNRIVKNIDEKCAKIDQAITQKEKLIKKLTQYKKSLIYECVTGKREVHHVG